VAAYGKFRRYHRVVGAAYGSGGTGDKFNDPLGVCGKDFITRVVPSRSKTVYPEVSVRIQHEFDDCRFFQEGNDASAQGCVEHLQKALLGGVDFDLADIAAKTGNGRLAQCNASFLKKATFLIDRLAGVFPDWARMSWPG